MEQNRNLKDRFTQFFKIKDRKAIQQMVLNKLDTHMQKKKAFLTLTPYQKNPKKSTLNRFYLKCKNKKLKFIDENIGENL